MLSTPREVASVLSREGVYPGDLILRDYPYRLPEQLTGVVGDLDVRWYSLPLPPGLKFVKGSLDLNNYKFPLPEGLTRVGGDIRLLDYNYPLPESLIDIGGQVVDLPEYKYKLPDSITTLESNLDLRNYKHPLPSDLVIVYGWIRLNRYPFPLPSRLEFIDGSVTLYDYKFALPRALRFVGGNLSLSSHKHPLPSGMTRVGGDLELSEYEYPLPDGFSSVGNDLDLRGYELPLPSSLQKVGGDIWLEGYPHPLPENLIVYGSAYGTESYAFKLPQTVRSDHYDIQVPSTEGFRRWFTDSKTVSESGRPIVFYHGTKRGGFSAFDPAKIDPHHPGFYFSDDISIAASYIPDPRWPLHDPTPELGDTDMQYLRGAYRVFLRLRNPVVVDCHGKNWNAIDHEDFPGLHRTYEIATEAKRRGYDGVIFRNIWDHGGESGKPKLGNVYVAFEPTQIKSALFNTGEFSKTDPDIRKNPRRTSRRSTRKPSPRAKTSRGR